VAEQLAIDRVKQIFNADAAMYNLIAVPLIVGGFLAFLKPVTYPLGMKAWPKAVHLTHSTWP
jgi:hypothetical protein